jgi:hypothetical protein
MRLHLFIMSKKIRSMVDGKTYLSSCFLGLLLLCASTLMYEITLTHLLSVTSWYYLALCRFQW